MNTNHIATAFDILVEEFARAIAETNTKGAHAFGRKDYRAVKTLAEAATRLSEYRSKVAAIEEQWSADAPPSDEPEKNQYLQVIATKLRLTLKKQSRISYVSGDGTTAVVCAVSKQYPSASPFYFFTIVQKQAELLAKHKQGFLVLGCGSPKTIFAIPFPKFEPWIKKLNTAFKPEGTYRLFIRITDELSRFYLHLKGRGEKVEITRFLLK